MQFSDNADNHKNLIISSTQTNSIENVSNKSVFDNLDCIKFTFFVCLYPLLQNNYIIL